MFQSYGKIAAEIIDLNNLKNAKFYISNSLISSNKIANLPEGVVEGGFFVSLANGGNNIDTQRIQFYFQNSGSIFIRTVFQSTINQWKYINDKDVKVINTTKLVNMLTTIKTSSDASVNTIHLSNAEASAIGQYLPTTNGGDFIDLNLIQFYFDNTNIFYVRNLLSTGWQEWKTINQFLEVTDYIDTLNNNVLGRSNNHLHLITFATATINNLIVAKENSSNEFKIIGNDYILYEKILATKSNLYLYFIPYSSTSEFYLYKCAADNDINFTNISNTVYDKTHEENEKIIIGKYTYSDLQQIGFMLKINYNTIIKTKNANDMILVWDGEKFGPKLFTNYNVKDDEGNDDPYPENGGSNLLISKRNVILIAKENYTFINCTATTSTSKQPIVQSKNITFPTQVLYFDNNTGTKNIKIVKNYNYQTGEYDPVSYTGCVNDYISSITTTESHTVEYPPINGRNYMDLIDMEWECKKDFYGADTQFLCHKGVTYNGCPYGSRWGTPSYIGWHVSKETFLNAANDEDSIFYDQEYSFMVETDDDEEEIGAHSGAYYGNVCSSFATLMSDFQYPMTNYSFINHPYVQVHKTNNLILNEIHTNISGHTIIPIGYEYDNNTNYDTNRMANAQRNYLILEQIGPLNRIYNTQSAAVTTNGSKHIFTESYARSYKWTVNFDDRRNAFSEIPYNISNVITLTNGDARPWKGHKSVYTSEEPVKINIKNGASILYLNKRGGDVINTFNVANQSQYEINKSYLEDNNIYDVWTNTSNIKESFEYHDVSDILYYSVPDGKLVFNDNRKFWYAICDSRSLNTSAVILRGSLSVGYESSGDYSNYREYSIITSLIAVFKKGTYGAYCLKIQKM